MASKIGSAAGGALSGAATGAAIGSVVPGIGTAVGAVGGGIIGGIGGWFSGDDEADDAERQRKQLLYEQALKSGRFADQGEANYNADTLQGRMALAGLRRQALGQDSVSAEQLRQALGQNLAAQRSLAAGAAPQDAAGAARTAAIQSARLGSGLAGQQAVAGLQERNQAQQQYGALLQGIRGQDLNASLGSRQNANTGYGAANAGAPQPSWIQQWGPAITAGLGAYAQYNKGGTAASDRRLKTEVKDGDATANKMLDALRAFSYRYKDEDAHGEGKQLGVMAQDLKSAGLKQAVIDTPGGMYVHGAKLAGANTAMIAALHRRLSKVEGAHAEVA
jgi:hypothetical protein